MRKIKILIVDDDTELAQMLAKTLALDGYEVCIANSAGEFRLQVFTMKPGLIILDIYLGNEDGPEVYKQLLNAGLDRNTPVIFLSALIPENPMPRSIPVTPGRKYAMHGKPFRYPNLVEDIRLLTGSHQGFDLTA